MITSLLEHLYPTGAKQKTKQAKAIRGGEDVTKQNMKEQ